MKKFILVHASVLLLISACTPNSDFSKKSVSSTFDISIPGSNDLDSPADMNKNGGSCTEITSYMMCLSSTSCEPVLHTNLPEVFPGQEEALFLKCISKIPADIPSTDILIEDSTVISTPPKSPKKDKDNDGSVTSNPKDPKISDPDGEVPTLPKSCDTVEAKYLLEKGKKVMICHNSANKRHTLIIACPALQAHIGHHDDILGSCKEE